MQQHIYFLCCKENKSPLVCQLHVHVRFVDSCTNVYLHVHTLTATAGFSSRLQYACLSHFICTVVAH